MSTLTARPIEVDQPKIPVRGLVMALIVAVVLVTTVVLTQQEVTPEAPASVTNPEAVAYWEEITAVVGEPVPSTGSARVDQATVAPSIVAATPGSVGYWEQITSVTSDPSVSTGSPAVDAAIVADAVSADRARAAATARLEGLAGQFDAAVDAQARANAAATARLDGLAAQYTGETSLPAHFQAMVDGWERQQVEWQRQRAQQAYFEAEVNGLLAELD